MLYIDRLIEVSSEDHKAIVAPLDAFSRGRGFLWQPSELAIALRIDEGKIVGGLIGEILCGWLRIELLAVADEFRGVGWGSRLVAEAENAAVVAGCDSSWVDTYSFPSPDFYRRLEYQVFGELPNYPMGQTRYFFSKQFVIDEKSNDRRILNFSTATIGITR